MRHKAKSGRALAVELTRITDTLADARVRNDRHGAHRAQRRLDSFTHKLTQAQREALLQHLDATEPAESAAAILLG